MEPKGKGGRTAQDGATVADTVQLRARVTQQQKLFLQKKGGSLWLRAVLQESINQKNRV